MRCDMLDLWYVFGKQCNCDRQLIYPWREPISHVYIEYKILRHARYYYARLRATFYSDDDHRHLVYTTCNYTLQDHVENAIFVIIEGLICERKSNDTTA